MKTKKFDRYTVDYSEDLDTDNLELIANAISPLAYINFNFNSLDSRILIAHGSSENQYRFTHYPINGAVFSNDSIYTGTLENLQDWVDRYDGEFNVLAVVSCNTHDKPLNSRKSVLVYTRIPISIKMFCESMKDFYSGIGLNNLKIYLPKDLRQRLLEDNMKVA